MFFVVWSLRTLLETVWTIAPTSFLGSTFGIANNDDTVDARKEESRSGVGGYRAQHRHQKKRYLGAPRFLPHFCDTKVTNTTNDMAIRTRY
jgi:hypothetical protein